MHIEAYFLQENPRILLTPFAKTTGFIDENAFRPDLGDSLKSSQKQLKNELKNEA